MGGNEEYELGLHNWSMPWEAWTGEQLDDFLDHQGAQWTTAAGAWKGTWMHCAALSPRFALGRELCSSPCCYIPGTGVS
jgi:hypothetical protein